MAEKQFLVMEFPPANCGLLSAICMLNTVANWDDHVWWDQWDRPEWQDPDWSLPLDQPEPKPVDPMLLLREGRAQLRKAVDISSLACFYRDVCLGAPQACLAVGEPLSPAALATLLFPLPAATQYSLRLLGTLPAVAQVVNEFADWPALAAVGTLESSYAGDPSFLDMAKLCLEGPPALSGPRVTAEESSWTPAASQLLAFLESDKRSTEDPPCALLTLTEALRLVSAIEAFDESTKRDATFDGDPERSEARRSHLLVKGDLARAWLYAVAPLDAVGDALPPRADALVPALWFAYQVTNWNPQSIQLFETLAAHSCQRLPPSQALAAWESSVRARLLLNEQG